MQREARQPEKPPLLKRAVQAIRSNRRLETTLYVGAALLVALLYVSTLLPEREKEVDPGGNAASAQSAMDTETRLTAVLSRIRGAGRVEVMITYDTGTELVTAMSTSTNSDSSEVSDGGKTSLSTRVTQSSQPATVGGSGGEPIVLLEKEPMVRGVIVVAEGAADVRVKLDLQRAVQAVLDVPLSKIEIFESALPGSQ